MHFFTEPSQLSISNNTQYFGPKIVVSLPDPEDGGAQDYFYFRDVFRVTSIFALASPAKAFACQDAMMIVQEHIDSITGLVNPNFVNIILKPLEGVDVPHTPVKYYIYRGVLKSSFISGTQITPDDPATKSEFITKFWKSWNDYKILMGTPALADPTPQSFGFGTLPNSQLVEEIYNSAESNNSLISDFQAIKVKEGEWIGNFGANDIGFEIVVDTENFLVNLEYVKKSNHTIDVTTLLNDTTPAGKFNLKVKREEVLNFIDPVAFFGMHYKVGVSTSTFSGTTKNTTNNKEETLYTEILSKFYNKECFYLDIRSERGFSYNFYNNYGDDQDVNILLTRTSDSVSQETHLKYEIGSGGFPLIISRPSIEYISPVYNKKVLILKLRTDDNLEPLLFLENTQLLGASNKTNYIEKESLLDTTTPGWTKEIRFEVPIVTVATVEQNLPYYIKIQYFRQKENPASPNTVLKNNNYLDAVFGGINISTYSVPTVFNHVRNTKRGFIKGSNFNYISETGIYFDDNRVLLYANNAYPHKESKSVYPKIDLTAFKFTPIVNSSVMLRDILFNKWRVEAPASLTIDILEIVGYNQNTRRATNIENIYLLGITKTEFDSLRNNTGITNLHQRYIAFEEVINQQDVVTGTPYKKYKLKLQGLDDSGVVVSVTPATDVFVYGSSSNMLCSKDFAAAAILQNVLPDPGTFEEFPLAEVWKYNKSDSYVLSTFPTGEVSVSDRGNVTLTQKVEPKANVFFPVDAKGDILPSAKKTNYPLIVIIHGNGHVYESYDKLCTHFAKNGFIAASISCLIKKNKIELTAQTFTYPPLPSPGITYDHLFFSEAGIYLYESGPKKFSKYEEISGVITITPMAWIEGAGKDFEIITNAAGNLQANFKTLSFDFQNMNITGRSNLLYPHLKIIKAKFGAKVQNNIGLMGHSRGGEAVVRAAKDIVSLPASAVPVDLKDINAIISLAPTDLWDEENLIQDIPYFVLYGSKDGDVSGDVDDTYPFRQTGSVGIVGTGGFSLYDRAKNQSEKAMTFVYGATHNGFITDNHDYRPLFPSLETESVQSKITFAYMNAFFRKHLKGENIWNAIIKGDHIPLSIQKTDIYPQYKNMNTSQIKEIQSFDSISSIPSQITANGGVSIQLTEFDWRVTSAVTYIDSSGSTVTTTKPVSGVYSYIFSTNTLKRIDKYSPHAKKGLYVDYTAPGEIIFSQAASGVDISNFNFISFRISHTVILPVGTYNNLSLIEVALKDASSVSNQTKIKKTIPAPDLRGPTRGYLANGRTPDKEGLTKSALLTVRIPLIEFGTVDLAHIKQVSFIIPSIGSGAFILDDIEFTI